MQYGIEGGIAQAKRAWDDHLGGTGRIHANILWEMGGAERVITGGARGREGADAWADVRGRDAVSPVGHRGAVRHPLLPDRQLLGARSTRCGSGPTARRPRLLGGVVYEDPWLAGGHNGLSNGEDPTKPEDPFPRVHGACAS